MLIPAAIAVLAALVALTVTWLLVQSTGRLGLDDARDPHRKFDHAPVSRLGGLGVAAGYAVVFLLAAWAHPAQIWADWWPVALITLGFFGLGFIDDLFPLGAKRKLLGQILLAMGAYSLGLRIELITSPTGDVSWPLGGASLLVTVLWLIAVPNIINLIDGMDGLASGLGIFVAVTLATVLFGSGQTVAGLLCLGFAAALLGFLIFNFPPARIYLGDGGAYLVGAFIATHSLVSSQKGSVAAMFFVVLIALGLPILDTAFAILRRGFIGLPVFHADAHHVHHYLQRNGISKRRTLLVLYGCCLVFCVIGLTIFWSQGIIVPTVLMAVFLVGICTANRFEIFEQWAKLRAKGFQVLRRRHQIRRAHAMGTYLMHELKHCDSEAEFIQLFDLAAARLGFVTPGNAPDRGRGNGLAQNVENSRAITRSNGNGGSDSTNGNAPGHEEHESEFQEGEHGEAQIHELERGDEEQPAFVSIEITNPGNPSLRLLVPAAGRNGQNWRLLAHCLYPPYVAARHTFNGRGRKQDGGGQGQDA